jgi:hypothetical protein
MNLIRIEQPLKIEILCITRQSFDWILENLLIDYQLKESTCVKDICFINREKLVHYFSTIPWRISFSYLHLDVVLQYGDSPNYHDLIITLTTLATSS